MSVVAAIVAGALLVLLVAIAGCFAWHVAGMVREGLRGDRR